MKIADYLLMRSSVSEIDSEKSGDSSVQISGRRIVLSFIGLILGIFFSFLITGIEKTTAQENGQETTKRITTEQSQASPEKTQSDTGQPQTKIEKSQSEPSLHLPGLNELFPLIVITLVICMLSYQGLYSSLKLYDNEPAFLLLFVAFQYGFFWESVVKGVGTII